jgi:hypothetical protein
MKPICFSLLSRCIMMFKVFPNGDLIPNISKINGVYPHFLDLKAPTHVILCRVLSFINKLVE